MIKETKSIAQPDNTMELNALLCITLLGVGLKKGPHYTN